MNRNWSKASQSSYGKASDGTIDAHFDLIPQIVRKSPTQIDGMSLTSDAGALPAHWHDNWILSSTAGSITIRLSF